MDFSTNHLRQTPSGDNVTRVDQSIEMTGRLLNRFAHVVFTVEVEDVCDEVESVLIILNFGVQASEIETVC